MRNRYAQSCYICGKHVPPQGGFVEKIPNPKSPFKWWVRCKNCVGTGTSEAKKRYKFGAKYKNRQKQEAYQAS